MLSDSVALVTRWWPIRDVLLTLNSVFSVLILLVVSACGGCNDKRSHSTPHQGLHKDQQVCECPCVPLSEDNRRNAMAPAGKQRKRGLCSNHLGMQKYTRLFSGRESLQRMNKLSRCPVRVTELCGALTATNFLREIPQ
jgi:hypothetical protein